MLVATLSKVRSYVSKNYREIMMEIKKLDKDAFELHKALSELVRAYQFRDRNRICYYDVSVTQCHAIKALVDYGAMPLNGLAAKLYLDKSTTSRVVDSLEQKGYVTRLVDPNDGRAWVLEVTDKGKGLHSKIEQDLINEMKQLLEGVDPDIRQATIRLFGRLVSTVRSRFSQKTKRCNIMS